MTDAALLDLLRHQLVEDMLSSMFGDGLEREYCWGGTEITGVNEMSDHDVVDTFLQSWCDDETDELVVAAKAWVLAHPQPVVAPPVNIDWRVELEHGDDITTTHVLSGPNLTSLGVMLAKELKDLEVLVDGGAYAPLTRLTVTRQ